MNNRLNDLAGSGGNPGRDLEAGNPSSTQNSTAAPEFMRDFFFRSGPGEETFDGYQNRVQRYPEDQPGYDACNYGGFEKKLSQQLSPQLQKANGSVEKCKDLLHKMREETKEKTENNTLSPNEQRIRQNLINTLTRKFAEVTKDYQKRQQVYKEDVKKKVTRQIRIVKEDATDEEIESIMQSEGGTGEVFKNAILKAAAPAKQAYNEAVEKYKEVVELNKSVEEVAQLFLDLALITEQQGELLDQIEFQVEAAAEYISKGNDDIEVAIDYSKSIRKKQCCVIVTVIVLAVIILAATGVFNAG
eukprot:CAMPEP_0185767482 /NCGR_PEP_ID=MMETSP1174-20130828/44011_1 /TAXON_ID=35687 /ORGANISM="Dictyocha speculum, Strain CCMP1381" /LENGTH=301 /DNA_ID=CAMNT_0028451719 /DNA_START=54 /DNA_END=960 /DNA_ORIENTATION=+